MPERTISVTCRDCGVVFEHVTRSNRPKLLCAECLKQSQRGSTNKHKRRSREAVKAAQPPRTCKDCDTDISALRGKVIRCEPCRREAAREYQRKLREANPKPARTFRCIICQTEIDRVGNSGKPLYCPDHALAARRSSVRRVDRKRSVARGAVWYTHCHYCKGELDTPRQRSGRGPARCDACKRQWHYAYMRARATERIANAKCLDCGALVNSKRKGPRKRCAACRKLRELERWRIYGGIYNPIRRARMRGVGSEKFTRQEIFDRDGWRCGICGRKIRKEIKYPHPLSVALDHKIPLGAEPDATHSRLNTQPAHKVCNERKNKRIIPVQLLLFA